MPPIRKILTSIHQSCTNFRFNRILGNDIDDTAHRLRAIQRTRRPLDDFDLLNIIDIDSFKSLCISQTGCIRFIGYSMSIDHDKRFIRIHPANNHFMSTTTFFSRLKNICIVLQRIPHIRRAALLDIRACDDLRRRRHILHIILCARRCDDDSIERIQWKGFFGKRKPPWQHGYQYSSSQQLLSIDCSLVSHFYLLYKCYKTEQFPLSSLPYSLMRYNYDNHTSYFI